MLQHFALRDADGLLAELGMHGCLSAARLDGHRVACAACRIEPGIDVCSVAVDDEWIAYALCELCRAAWPGDKVTRLVDRAIASGQLTVVVDTFEEDEDSP